MIPSTLALFISPALCPQCDPRPLHFASEAVRRSPAVSARLCGPGRRAAELRQSPISPHGPLPFVLASTFP
eukprot:7361169-Pyramimonas_sp.AAC.1